MATRASIKADADAADAALAAMVAAQTVAPVTEPTPPVLNDDQLPPVQPAPTPAPAPVAQPIADADAVAQMAHRLSTLEGMYNRSEADKQQLAADNARLRAAPPAAPAPAPAPAPRSLLTDKEVEEFGPDFIDVVTRVAKQTVNPSINLLIRRIEVLEGNYAEVAQKANVAHNVASKQVVKDFETQLTELVPDWEILNTDQKFLAFLAKPDIFSGKIKHELLQQALADDNAERVASFFIAYKSGSNPAPVAEIPAQPPAPPARPSIDPRNLIAPSASAPAPANANPANGRIWTNDEVGKVYDDKMKGRISPADFLILEAQIMRAFEENRISA